MNKLFVFFFYMINLITISQSLGITNYTKFNDQYIINIASEDVEIFEQKLYNKLINIKTELYMIIINDLLSTLLPYIIIILPIVYIRRNISFKFYTILYLMILISDLIYFAYIWNDYKFGIKSAEIAITNYNIAMENGYNIDPRKTNYRDRKFKINYLSDEIKKFGIHAVFCEIPGKLPSNNANPSSFSFSSFCFYFKSQRKYLDPESYDYVGDEESIKYRTIQINKTFDLF